MKSYYVVWNECNYGSGAIFYGVCPNYESAERLFNEVCKNEGLNPKNPYRDEDGCVDSINISKLPFIKY